MDGWKDSRYKKGVGVTASRSAEDNVGGNEGKKPAKPQAAPLRVVLYVAIFR